MVLKIFNQKFICVFCDERQRKENSYIMCGRIGICRNCYDKISKTVPSQPYKGTHDIAYIMSPFEYTGPLRKAILNFKFNNCRAYAPLFAEMMEEYLDSFSIWDGFDYIIPVPLHEKRLKERGYNQSELVAKHVADYLYLPLRNDLLSRTRATKQQSSLERLERITNVSGAFNCNENLSGKRIILFDDICTTGNTLQACAAALKKSGAENICALTLAIHASKDLPIIMY